MALYLVSYDIDAKDKDEYEGLWAELRNMNATRILYSEWLIAAGVNEAVAIYDSLTPHIRQDDRLLVQEVCGQAAWDKLMITDDAFRKILISNTRR